MLVGHGSRDPRAAAVLQELRDAVAAELATVPVTLAWLEFGRPLLTDVLPDFAGRPAPAVVPLLLSRGTHVSRDIPPGASPPLAPDPLLTEALLDRIAEAGIAKPRPLVLAASGSIDPNGLADVDQQATLLQAAWGAPVRAGFVTCEPSVAQTAEALKTQVSDGGGDRERPAIVSFFLAPGRLPDSAGADTAPLGSHPAVVALLLARYRRLLRLA